ncbi:hypothetical protein [Niveispirillum fermenti]|uniref:tetratricopeptide repeat protein n=1 Tax=Niveispirillum fermenti TaxID=1233113 RepID=UPI003A87A5AC
MMAGRLRLRRALVLGVALGALLAAPPSAAQQSIPAPAENPPAPAAAPALRVPVRSGVHPTYSRLVFDWPRSTPYSVEQNGTAVSIRFPVPAELDLAAVARARPSRIAGLSQTAGDGAVTLRFDIPAGAGLKDSRVGNRIVVDVLDRPPPGAIARPTNPAAATTAPASAAPAAATTAAAPPAADPRGVREGAPLYEMRGRPAPGAITPPAQQAATGAPTALVPPPAQTAAPGPAASSGPGASPSGTAASAPSAAAATPVTPAPLASPVPAPAPVVEPAATAVEAAAAPVVLVFDPKVARSAAVFERAGFLHVLFDGEIPDGAVPAPPPELPVSIDRLDVPDGAGFRFPMPALMQASVQRDGTAWRLLLSRTNGQPPSAVPDGPDDHILTPEPDLDFALGSRLVVAAPDAGTVLAFHDPVVGDMLKVVPLPQPGSHMPVPLRYAEVQFLPTLQGIVVRPLDDRLLVQPVREGVEVSVPGGLTLSPAADVQVAVPPPPPAAEEERLFDFQRWGQVPLRDFTRARQERWDRLAAMPEAERTRGRLDIARFYLANGLGYEALGMLSRVQELQPDVDRRPEFLAVRGIGRALTGDYAGAQADLSNRQLSAEPDAALWRAAALAGQQDFDGANTLFTQNRELLDRYPEPFYTGLALSATDAALKAGHPDQAASIMDRVAKRGGETGPQAAAVQYFRGAVFRALGDNEKALPYFASAQEGRDRLYAMRGKRDYIDTALDLGRMEPKEAARQMETLRFAWRGDALELSNLRRIGEVHALAGNYPQAFDTMRQTISQFPNTRDAGEIASDLTRTFTNLFANDGAASMSAVEALALYEQYRELTPPGPDGDRIIRRLAERLVEIDLLDRAAQLLDHQVQYRLTGTEKAQVGARLAGIRLLDGKPDDAIAALDKSLVDGLPPELVEERKLLRARALSQTGKGADAVQLLATDQSHNANLLRVDIAMRDRQWPAAAAALGDLIGPPPAAGAALEPQTAGLVINHAIALSLAQDNAGLETLRRDFGPAMENSRDANTFRLLTRPEEAAGLADAATIRSRITEIDLFRNFLDNYRTARQEAAAPPPAAAPATPAQPPS